MLSGFLLSRVWIRKDLAAEMNPIDAALAVRSRDDLVAYLNTLAGDARAGRVPVENITSPDFIEASAAWLAGLDQFLRSQRVEVVSGEPSWLTIAMIFSAGLVYE
jgi:hypothetical protein